MICCRLETLSASLNCTLIQANMNPGSLADVAVTGLGWLALYVTEEVMNY